MDDEISNEISVTSQRSYCVPERGSSSAGRSSIRSSIRSSLRSSSAGRSSLRSSLREPGDRRGSRRRSLSDDDIPPRARVSFEDKFGSEFGSASSESRSSSGSGPKRRSFLASPGSDRQRRSSDRDSTSSRPSSEKDDANPRTSKLDRTRPGMRHAQGSTALRSSMHPGQPRNFVPRHTIAEGHADVPHMNYGATRPSRRGSTQNWTQNWSDPTSSVQSGRSSYKETFIRNTHESLEGDDDGEMEDEEWRQDEDWIMKLMELKTTVYDTYSICAALLTSFCVCSMYVSVNELRNWKDDQPLRYWLVTFQQVCNRICIALGLYSMLIFMFCAMYIKSALSRPFYGMALFEQLEVRTKTHRNRAFFVLYYTSLTMAANLTLGLFYSLHCFWAYVASGLILVIVGFTIQHTGEMIRMAGIMFLSDEDIEAQLLTEGYCYTDDSSQHLEYPARGTPAAQSLKGTPGSESRERPSTSIPAPSLAWTERGMLMSLCSLVWSLVSSIFTCCGWLTRHEEEEEFKPFFSAPQAI